MKIVKTLFSFENYFTSYFVLKFFLGDFIEGYLLVDYALQLTHFLLQALSHISMLSMHFFLCVHYLSVCYTNAFLTRKRTPFLIARDTCYLCGFFGYYNMSVVSLVPTIIPSKLIFILHFFRVNRKYDRLSEKEKKNKYSNSIQKRVEVGFLFYRNFWCLFLALNK